MFNRTIIPVQTNAPSTINIVFGSTASKIHNSGLHCPQIIYSTNNLISDRPRHIIGFTENYHLNHTEVTGLMMSQNLVRGQSCPQDNYALLLSGSTMPTGQLCPLNFGINYAHRTTIPSFFRALFLSGSIPPTGQLCPLSFGVSYAHRTTSPSSQQIT
jgi:hypothetical protein